MNIVRDSFVKKQCFPFTLKMTMLELHLTERRGGKILRKTWTMMLTFILIILVLAACGNGDTSDEGSEKNDGQEASLELPEPDLEGIPDIVAEINGEEITKEEFESMYEQQFQQAAMQSQLSGQEVDQDQLKEQTAEGMVNQRLLTQEANNRIAEVLEEDVNNTLDEVVKQNGMETKEELLAALEEQGMKEKEVMELIETQVKIDQLIAEESGNMEPTDDEVKEAYDNMKAQQEEMGNDEEFPAFDEIEPDLKEQVKQQKEMEATETLVEKLRKDADVTIYL